MPWRLGNALPVLAVDLNPVAAACALANVRVLSELKSVGEPLVETGRSHAIQVLCADVTSLDLARLRNQGFGAAFFDPSRRVDTRDGRKRARNAEDYLPPLSWLNALADHFPCVGVKVSPAIDDETLLQFTGQGATVEFIAEGNECKEAVLWRSSAADTRNVPRASASGEPYSATIIGKDGTAHTLCQQDERDVPLSEPRAWLFEPNPAVIRAHLVPQVAQSINATQIAPDIAYLTADDFTNIPFATAYRVLEWMPYHPRNVQAWLRTNGRRVEVVKKRDVDLEPEEVRKKLSSSHLADKPPVVLVLMRRKEQTLAILCEPATV